MNPTRTFLVHRAAAIVAQLQDRRAGDDVNERVALRLEYRDLRCAMRRVPLQATANNERVPVEDSLWAAHCVAHGLPIDHDAVNL